ncbi:MAG: potassium/proton antiporter [Bacillota bacterium]|nr:potassium/proton antiporter [Bacillota bacterium]
MDILIVAIILFLAIFAIKISNRSGIPSLLIFIVFGIIFSKFGFDFNNYEIADKFASLALMIIIFQGGFSTKWKMAKPVAREAIIMSLFGTLLTALITGIFCHYFLKVSYLEGMLLGSVISSTDFASVSNILRSQNLNLKYSTAPLLELESGSNDPTAYTLTMIFLSLLLGREILVPLTIFTQIAFGLVVGFGVSLIFMKIVRIAKFDRDGLFIIFLAATALFTFSFANLIKGNGYLATYVFGIYVGNQQFKGKRQSVFFLDGITSLLQIGLFFMLGLLSNVDAFISHLPEALAVCLFLLLVSRPFATFLLLAPFKGPRNQKLMISLAGIRGAAAIAFAILVINSGVKLNMDIYHIVFGVCVISALLQGSIMPWVSRKLDILDPNDTVLKNFNDYQDKSELGFIQTVIRPGSRWINQPVSTLNLAFNIIVAKIERRGKTIVPRGSTVLKEDDLVVLGGEVYFDRASDELVELTIPHSHPWANKTVKEINLPDDELIIMVQTRDNEIIVPTGATIICEGDTLVTIKANEDDPSFKGLKKLKRK